MHFLVLFIEYNLLPIAIFLFTFFTKKNAEDRAHNTLNSYEIKNSALEFVLIESFTGLAILLRIWFDIHYEKGGMLVLLFLWFMIIIVFLLAIIFFYFISKVQDIELHEVSHISFCFFASLTSWLTRLILLLIYSHILCSLNFFAFLTSFVIYFLGFFSMNFIYSRHVLGWKVLLQMGNSYFNNQKFSKTIRIGKKIMQISKNKEGEFYGTYHAALELTGSGYLMCDKTRTNKILNFIQILEKYIQKPESKKRGLDSLQKILAGLYCKSGKSDYAMVYFSKNYFGPLPEKYINILKRGEYTKMVD
jgi:hypothetical protein